MTTKHPLARLFGFIAKMSHTYEDNIATRLDLYLNYVSGLDAKSKVEMYDNMSDKLNMCFMSDTTITRSDLIAEIPDRWPCEDWFEMNNLDINLYDDPDEEFAVFDYYDITVTLRSTDHQRLVMLLVLDAVKHAGNTRCNNEMENLKTQIEDKKLLSENGYGSGAELLATATELITDFTPKGADLLTNLVDVYNSGDGSFGLVIEEATNMFLEEDTIAIIKQEVTQHSNEIAKDTSKITDSISKIAKAAGMSDEITDVVKDISIEVISDPDNALEVMTRNASNFTGIDADDLRNVVSNVRKIIPTEELDEMAQVVTQALEQPSEVVTQALEQPSEVVTQALEQPSEV